ncbi:MAG: polyprenol monophosphomannose synthase, partial [Chloroflexota bacterium]
SERVSVIHRAGKLGLGTAYIAGFRQALARGYAYAITMDADFSHNPRYLPALLGLMPAHDLGIGSRYVPGGGTTGWPLARRFLSRGANAFARTMLGLKAHDCTAGFRCYKAEVLRAVELDTIFSSGYSFLVEMATRCQRRGYSVGEIPIIFENRRLGSSKISRVEIFKSVYTIFRLRCAWLPWERWSARRRQRQARAAGK